MRHHLFNAANIGRYRDEMARGVAVVADHVAGVDGPWSGADVRAVSAKVDDVDLERPLDDMAAVLDEVRSVYLDDAVWFHEPRYLAHLNCPVVVPALVAEVLVSSVNSSLDTWDQSGGGTQIERRLVRWTSDRIGLGPDADGVFTSGGTQSNLQALLVARGQAYLAGDASRLRVFASRDSHFSVQKSADVLGLGPDAVVTIPTDRRRRMDAVALDRAVWDARAAGLVPMAVVATAGTTDYGSIDPLVDVADVCAQHGVWMHVDAAYGGGLLVSTRRRHLLDGIERADSVTVDFHKTFFQPVSSSAVLFRHGDSLRHVTYHADYLNPRSSAQPNQVDKSLQTTRRFDALKLWMTLRAMGADAIGDYVDAVVDLAAAGHGLMLDDPDLEVVTAPTLSTLVFRFRPPGMSDDDADRVNPAIRRAIAGSGSAVVAGTRSDGRAWLKLTMLNPETTPDDLRAVLALVTDIGHELLDDLRATQEVH
ncbi:pyridoxal phosphate-dependent decarboxylase family protein [Aeromicrobium fastidiosum]|uniref:pyridoxal phosphate-dependent decarboxylase family protein n=1 Tax=Aeromicrobium fastidiosum TaxID=52699 RepID=UPI0027E03F5F|nr:aspartate aminotransferase family protein [Aeromicrobium fastidiosum]